MKELFFGVKFIVRYWLTKSKDPLIFGLVLHNDCNPKRKYCEVSDRIQAKITYQKAVEAIDRFYAEGGRCLYLEGGEPFVWYDGDYEMEDIVRYAKQKGYYTVIVYTNGTNALQTMADTLFVSVDGLQETHDRLRGKSFVEIMTNIKQSYHHSIYINFAINSFNKNEIECFCEHMDYIKNIRGIFFYFHASYYGTDGLFLDEEERRSIILRLLTLKKRYRILNSTAGLKTAYKSHRKKNLGICKVFEGDKFYQCCRESNNDSLCNKCGYLSYAEIDQTLKLKPKAIINALKYF